VLPLVVVVVVVLVAVVVLLLDDVVTFTLVVVLLNLLNGRDISEAADLILSAAALKNLLMFPFLC
jgi:hypothetical protein